MSAGKAIYAILQGDATLKNLVGTDSGGNIKVYPVTPPQKVTLPFVVYEQAATQPSESKDGKSSLDLIQIRVYAYDKTYNGVHAIKDRIRFLLDYFGGTSGGVTVQTITFADEEDAPPDLDIGAFAVSQDYNVRIIIT